MIMNDNNIVPYKNEGDGFGWVGDPACGCIVAVYLKEEVSCFTLEDMVKGGDLTQEEYDAITAFDKEKGTESDLKILQKLAKRLNLEMEFVS